MSLEKAIRWGLIPGFIALLVLAAVALVAPPAEPVRFLTTAEESVTTGAFAVAPAEAIEQERPQIPAQRSFRSYSPSRNVAGTFRSGAFSAPATLHFFLRGAVVERRVSIYLLDVRTSERLTLRSRIPPNFVWRARYWRLPPEWRGRRVALVVEDGGGAPDAWVGVTLPQSGGESLPYAIARAGFRISLLCAEALLFLLPGLVAMLFLQRRLRLSAPGCVALVFVVSGAVGYLTFWVYLNNRQIGRAYSVAMTILVLGLITVFWRQGKLALLDHRPELARVAALVFLLATFNFGLGSLYVSDDFPGESPQVRYTAQTMPPDNVLPEILALSIYEGRSFRPFPLAGLQSSDRPPLQSGIALFQHPFWRLMTKDLSYFQLAVFLQATWIAGLWALLRASSVRYRYIVPVLAFCVFSGTNFVHGVFTWPKMLAANFCFLGLCWFPFLRGESKGWTQTAAVLAGAAFALAYLSHPGASFTIIGAIALAFFTRTLPPARLALWGAAAMLILMLPWIWYQKFYDPPGDSLPKLYLTGRVDPGLSVGAAVIKTYSATPVVQLIANRLMNFYVLFAPRTGGNFSLGNLRDRVALWNQRSFFNLSYALGVANLGFLAGMWIWFTRGARSQRPCASAELRFANRVMLLMAVDLVVWCLLFFGPGETVIHQGSLANVLLLFTGLVLWLGILVPRAVWILLAIHIAGPGILFALGERWALTPPGLVFDGPPDPGMAALCAFGFCGLALWGWRVLLVRDGRDLNP